MASSVHHPSALRNRGPILEQLQQILSADTSGYALEVACNTGAHMEVFAPAFPKLTWQPSDRDLSAAEAYSTLAGVLQGMPNVLEPLSLDLCQPVDSWPPEVLKQERSVRLFYASNVTHISPWEVTVGLLAGAGRLLQEDGDLVIYGPFKENGGFSTESNEAFDARLRAQDPEWGYRDVQDLEDEARKSGLFLKMRIDMPANNLLLHFKRKS